jgi:hypothetical protein
MYHMCVCNNVLTARAQRYVHAERLGAWECKSGLGTSYTTIQDRVY